MKVTIEMPTELTERIRLYIRNRFGNGKVRAFSLVIREAVMEYLNRREQEK